MKWLVLLAGCGLGDGSCVEEVVLSYAALDKYHCDYTPVAENISVSSIDHISEQHGEPRNALVEAARIGRGRIKCLSDVVLDEYDALLIPGGIGLVVNYRTSSAVKACIEQFTMQGKPIGTMCAGIDFLRGIMGAKLLQRETTELTAVDFCCDHERNIFYTPAFRKTGSCYDTMLGIEAMIYAMRAAKKSERQ